MVRIERSAGPAACPAPARATALCLAASPGWLPRVTVMTLPSTRVAYGMSVSTLTTTRVRPLASAASTVSTPPDRTSMRRDASARLVFGRSNAMRAGLSMVKGSGSGAGPLMCNFSCTCWPDKV